MNFLKKNKITIGGALVVVVLAYGYFTYFSGSSAPLTAMSDTSVSGDLLVTLGSLGAIKLDSSIFTNPVFVSLSDFGVSIPPQDAGRRNPFAPIGVRGAAPSTGSGQVGTSTKR